MKWIQGFIDFFATSLQRKLMLLTTTIVVLVMIAFGFLLVNNQRENAINELESRATRTGGLLSQTVALPLWNLDWGSIQSQLDDAVKSDEEVNAVRVFETGKDKPTVESVKDTPPVDPISHTAEIIFQRGDERTRLGTVVIVYSSEVLRRQLTQTTLLIVVSILVLTIFIFIGIYLLVGRFVTDPLHEMTTLTSRVAAGDLTGSVKLNSRDEMSTLAAAFNSMTAQLRQTLEGLEQRVQDRTADLEASKVVSEKHAKDLEAVADISRSVAAIQDMDELLQIITSLISARFGFYHTGIYLLDEAGDYVVMRATSSEGGLQMLKNGHKLRVEASSLIGFAALRGQARVAADVNQDSTYMAVPELPDTRSEVVFPLVAGAQTIGVLDVQSTQPNAFSESAVNILNTVANQVAISIQNAHSFGETRRALAEAERIYQQFVQQGWSQIVKGKSVLGYKYSSEGLFPIEAAAKAGAAVLGQEPVMESEPDQAALLSIPIKLRDQTIGMMRVRSTKPAREWDQDELAMAQATAERAALALENARLLEDSQRRATRERAIGEISARISEKSEIDAILRSTVEELGKKLRDSAVAIQIGRKE